MPAALLLDAGDALSVRAAAPDMQVRLIVPATILARGVAAVTAHTFSDLIGLLDDRDLLLDSSGGQLRIQGFQVDSSLQLMDADTVPAEFPIVAGMTASIPAAQLFQACSRVGIAIARDDTAPILTGAMARFSEGELLLAATDGRRLAIDEIRLTETEGEASELVLPAKLVGEVPRILDSAHETIRCVVDASGQRIALATATVSVRALGLDGRYPNFAARMSKPTSTGCTVLTELLLRRLQAAAMFAPDEARSIQVQAEPGRGLVFDASSANRGTTTAEVEANVTGAAASLSVDPQFLIEGLRAIGGAEVELRVAEDPPALLLRRSPADQYLYLQVARTRLSG